MWIEAKPKVIEMARELVQAFHPSLLDARIGFLMRDPIPKRRNKLVYGDAALVSEKLKPLMPLDFIIWIAYDAVMAWPEERVRALIDHQLSHCIFDATEMKAGLCDHDVEGFLSELQRWGAWNYGLMKLQRQAQQLTMDDLLTDSQHMVPKETVRGMVLAVDVKQMNNEVQPAG